MKGNPSNRLVRPGLIFQGVPIRKVSKELKQKQIARDQKSIILPFVRLDITFMWDFIQYLGDFHVGLHTILPFIRLEFTFMWDFIQYLEDFHVGIHTILPFVPVVVVAVTVVVFVVTLQPLRIWTNGRRK